MRKFSIMACTTALVTIFAQSSASAQDNDPSDGLGEIIVTAERSKQNLQKVSQSVTAIDANKLELLGIKSAADLGAFVPGVTIKQGNAPSIFIRGVGTSLSTVNGDPGVAIHIDGVFQTRSTALNAGFFDIDHIEVLKGPQGTLYGRGSIGGSVNIITAAPKMDYEGAAAAEVGNYGLVRAQGMLNLPLDEQTQTAFRVAFLTESRDGYASNGTDDAQNSAIRARLRTSPLEQLTIDLNGMIFRGKSRGVGFYPARSYSPTRVADVDNYHSFIDASTGYYNLYMREGSINIDYDLGFATLSFLPSWTEINNDNRVAGLTTINGVAGSDNLVTSILRSSTAMQELRLSSPQGSPITWVTGLYHLRENNSYIVANGRISGVVITDSKSAFGQATIPLSSALRVIGGIRYTDEKKDQSTNVNYSFTSSWKVWNYRGSVEYDVARASMLYATFATGFKAGGFFVSTPPNDYDPERVKTIELGSKNRFLDNSLQVNAAAFYSKYKKYQVQVTIPPAFVGATSAGVFNGGDAEVKGAELEIIYQLSNADRIEVSGNYTDGTFTTITVTGTTAREGDRLPSTAKYSGNIAYTHDFAIPTGKLSLRAETHLESASWLSLNHNSLSRQKSYSKSNLTLTYAPDEGDYTISAWVRNLEDEAVRGSIVDSVNNDTYTLGAPRTYGVSVSKKF